MEKMNNPYEIYDTVKMRPNVIKTPLVNPGIGVLPTTKIKWRDIESKRGVFDFGILKTILEKAKDEQKVIALQLCPEAPDWVGENEKAMSFACFVREVGSRHGECPYIYMVDVSLPGCECDISDVVLHTVADAYIEAFPNKYKMISIKCGRLANYFKDTCMNDIGLIVEAKEGFEYFGQQLARLGLQNVWEKAPIRLIADDVSGDLQNEATRWHVSSIDVTGKYDRNWAESLGYRFEIRRIHHPTVMSSAGALPLRLWMTNVGNAPCYKPIGMYTRLTCRANEGEKEIVKTKFDAGGWLPGDSIYNEIIEMPGLKDGIYDLGFGMILSGSDVPLALATEGGSNDGYYDLSTINVDGISRPEMFKAWDDVYPDGYYPLEDPKVPV